MSEERRKQQRLDSLNISYVCEDEDGDIVLEGIGRTLNVSESGILLETNFKINPAHTLILEIAFEDTLVDLRGKAIYCHVESGTIFHTGISFTDLDDTSLKALRYYISHFEENQG
ncbi:MAG: PilZ domain-containing protein [Desulfobulbaceae bacterium]|nr:PilZ domain-containing protein [Desulfobulbaceae bacterium]